MQEYRSAMPLLLVSLLASCSGGSAAAASSAIVPIASPIASAVRAIDPKHVPLGDGHVSSVAPLVGSVYSCQSTFNGGGAFANGPWILSDGTWDSTSKVAVLGSVTWPAASFTETLASGMRMLVSTGLPNHATGVFPIAASDPAYAYDRNPNSIAAQAIAYSVPANPVVASTPTCLGLGPIGIMTSGVVLFNALDAGGRDAVAHEEQDACHGHPERSSTYHYHDLSSCIADPGTGHSNLLGYARDGFGIFGNRGESGTALVDADLDACHGHTHAIAWDGAVVTMYHYHATKEYPYTIGCYRGTAP